MTDASRSSRRGCNWGRRVSSVFMGLTAFGSSWGRRIEYESLRRSLVWRSALARLTSRRLHDDSPARGMKAHRTLHWRNMVAFHEEIGPFPIIQFAGLARCYSRKTYIRNRSDGAVKTSRTSLKPASWPSSCHCEVVSGMSDAWTCAVIASHSSVV